ncbi:hypothetical protein AGR13a_Cc290038 [Agrobacterium genomosp. 13 str. CFBP 6927]|uniref:Uncharacterized protein n=1 Tax=Agrobacterium genomosp. 13 str. CFBP 6927 TaxID=1183428 RepID=A0ABP2BHH2_9HYPH|nr:hypothetical protein AGR13a_Cc290038 [Agrobacterium genomosp. 13 str. CFBP 6927]
MRVSANGAKRKDLVETLGTAGLF